MEWKKLAPWNWFEKEESARVPAASGRGALDPLAGLQAEFDRFFENTFRRYGGQPPPESGIPLRPRVDISEGRNQYAVRVEIPGAGKEDVTIAVEGDALVIHGEKRQEREEGDEHFHCVERAFGAFERVLALPEDVDAGNIAAKFRNGVLKITIPKLPERASKARRVEILHD